MDSDFADSQLSSVAGAIADPARARMLCLLLDGRARTATELAAAAEIGASTASSHFQRLRDQGLVEQAAQGKHRYYRLANGEVARALEALLVVAGAERTPFKPSTPSALREARTCYDHMAGTLAVRMHDAMLTRQWLAADGKDYALTPLGEASLAQIGVDAAEARRRRRRFACLPGLERAPSAPGRRAGRGLAGRADRTRLGQPRPGFTRGAPHAQGRAPVSGVLRRCRRAGRRGQLGHRVPSGRGLAQTSTFGPRMRPFYGRGLAAPMIFPFFNLLQEFAVPTLALPAIRLALGLVTELRIDVNHTPDEVESELDAIRNRMSRSSDRLYGLPEVRTDIPGLVLRHREADGEYYVYVVDLRRDRVAGYTVFNRLIEVGRRADPYLRAPHSKYAAPYQRMGLATAVYRWGWTRDCAS